MTSGLKWEPRHEGDSPLGELENRGVQCVGPLLLGYKKGRALLVHLAHAILWLFDAVVLAAVRRREESGPRRVVVWIRPDNLGDLILWSASLSSARALFPPDGWRHVAVVNKSYLGAAESMGIAESYIGVDVRRFRKSLRYRAGIVRRILESHAEVAIAPRPERGFADNDAMIRSTKARRRIGWRLNRRAQWTERMFGNRAFTELLDLSVGEHELEKNRALMEYLGAERADLKLPDMGHLCRVAGAGDSYCVLAPGAAWSGRRWDTGRYAWLAARLAREYGLRVVALGSASERELCQEIVAQCEGTEINVHAGDLSLVEISSLIGGARLFIGNESGPFHIAAALRVPAICIAGGGHAGRFVPYPEPLGATSVTIQQPMPCFGCEWMCIFEREANAPTACIDAIDAQSVWAVASHLVTSQTVALADARPQMNAIDRH